MDLDNIFTYHRPVGDQAERYEKLRPAFKSYAEALLTERIFDENEDLIIELAYEDIVRTVTELVPVDAPEYDRSMEFINEAYDLAVHPDRVIVQAVQAASMFANSAIAINE